MTNQTAADAITGLLAEIADLKQQRRAAQEMLHALLEENQEVQQQRDQLKDAARVAYSYIDGKSQAGLSARAQTSSAIAAAR